MADPRSNLRRSDGARANARSSAQLRSRTFQSRDALFGATREVCEAEYRVAFGFPWPWPQGLPPQEWPLYVSSEEPAVVQQRLQFLRGLASLVPAARALAGDSAAPDAKLLLRAANALGKLDLDGEGALRRRCLIDRQLIAAEAALNAWASGLARGKNDVRPWRSSASYAVSGQPA